MCIFLMVAGVLQGAPADSGNQPGQRPGAAIDRWEPGSDFDEAAEPMQRVSKRRLNGADSSAPAVRAAPPSPQSARTGLLEPVTASVAGPGRSDRSPNRSEPASCLVLACVHLLQGGAWAAEQQLSCRQRAAECIKAGQRKGGASGFWARHHPLRQHMQLLPVC